MTAAKPLARYGAIEGARSRAASLPPSYTTSGDATLLIVLGLIHCPESLWVGDGWVRQLPDLVVSVLSRKL